MEQLLLINPAPRKKGAKKMAKRRRSAAQKAATRRMLAARRAKYSHNPSPRKRRAHSKRRVHRNPIAHRVHHRLHSRRKHYRRNPSPRGIGGMFMPAIWGAAGALGVDLITGYIPLPLSIKVSPARHLVKAVLAVGLGMVSRSGPVRAAAEGALTVAFHDAAREAVQMMAPNVQLGAEPTVADLAGIGYYNPAQVQGSLGYYQPEGMAGITENGYTYTGA